MPSIKALLVCVVARLFRRGAIVIPRGRITLHGACHPGGYSWNYYLSTQSFKSSVRCPKKAVKLNHSLTLSQVITILVKIE